MANTLTYDDAGDHRILEKANWIGEHSTGLHCHFHDDVQISVVWNGHRDYLIGSTTLRLYPNEILIMPALISHHALPSRQPLLRSAEFYVAPAMLPEATRKLLDRSDYLVIPAYDLTRVARGDVADFFADLILRLETTAIGSVSRARQNPIAFSFVAAAIRRKRIEDAARDVGFTREGFIRAFFRSRGMTPHAYRINRKLNEGRQLLRAGEPIAEVAHAIGFNDQSHFGRAFLSYFGTTPGKFRDVHRIRC